MSNDIPEEPFYRDQRLAELGFAFESVLFGGDIRPLTCDVAAPFGFVVDDWPGVAEPQRQPGRATELGYTQRGGPTKWKVRWNTEYMVPMDFIKQFFTR